MVGIAHHGCPGPERWTVAKWKEYCEDHYKDKNEGDGLAVWRGHSVDAIKNMIGDLKIDSIIEYGCGRGAVLDAVATFTKASRAVGVDISEGQIARARELHQHKDWTFIVEDFEAFKKREKFDLVIAFSVMLHIPPTRIKAFAKKLIASSKRYIIIVDVEGEAEKITRPEAAQWWHDHRSLFKGCKELERQMVETLPLCDVFAMLLEVRK